jgi:UDP-glucose 4-epimerase
MILVTGGLGFIGAHLSRALLDAGESVVATRHRRADVPPFLQGEPEPRFGTDPLDVNDGAAVRSVLERRGIPSIVHLAVAPIGQSTFQEEFDANLGGLVKVLEAASQAGVRRVTVASSIAVYMSLGSGPFAESMNLPLPSRLPTEAFKKCEEILAQHYADRLKLDVRCVRIASVYGPLYRTLINAPSRIVHAAVRGVRGPLPNAVMPEVFADAANDFGYVKDVAEGICRVHRAEAPKHRVYNIGAGEAVSPQRLLEAVRRVLPESSAEFRPGSNLPRDHYMDISRAADDLGYRPTYGLERGVADYIDWLKAGHER